MIAVSEIPLLDSNKLAIIKAIADGYKKDIQDFKAEFNIETFNSIHFLKWDFANTNIINTLTDDRFQCIKVKRGSWTIVMIYDTETHFLYTLMKEERLAQLQDRVVKEKVHYLDALSSINKGLEGKSNHNKSLQLSFFTEESVWDESVESLLEELLGNLKGKVEQYVLIAFSMDKSEIKSIRAIIPNEHLAVTYEEEWTDLIPVDFDTSNPYESSILEDEDEEIEIKLRKNAILNEDNLIQLRNDKTEKKQDK